MVVLYFVVGVISAIFCLFSYTLNEVKRLPERYSDSDNYVATMLDHELFLGSLLLALLTVVVFWPVIIALIVVLKIATKISKTFTKYVKERMNNNGQSKTDE